MTPCGLWLSKKVTCGNYFKNCCSVAFLILILFLRNDLFGQACCTGGVPIGGSLGLGTADAKSIQVLLTYDNNVLNDLMAYSSLLEDDTRRRKTQSVLLEVNYGLSDRFAITALIPTIRQERSIADIQGGREITTGEGLGDIMLLLKYRLINPAKNSDWDWVAGAGPMLPTGRADLRNNQGFVMQADMQPGSGALSAMFWSYAQKSHVFHPNLSLIFISTYRYSGTNNSYNFTQSYRFGNELQLNLGVNYNLFTFWPTDLFLYGRYRHQGPDIIDDGVFPGSGGTWTFIVPGININFNPDFSFRLSADLPLYRFMEGTQLTTSYRITGALFFNIPLKKSMN